MPSSTMSMYLRLLRWYTSFIFEDILTFSMSRDLFSKIDLLYQHMDITNNNDTKLLAKFQEE